MSRHIQSSAAACSVVTLLISLVSVAVSTEAATIRVAQDGSGDYTSLFDGLAAAQDGDTVSIGPGEYTETRLINPTGGFEYESMGYVSASNVTVVGDDRDAVLIGPATPPPGLNANGVRGLTAGAGAANVVFSNLTIRNVSRGFIDVDMAASVQDCQFTGNYYGIWQAGLGTCVVERSRFSDNGAGILAIQGYGSRDLQIRECSFENNIQGMQIQNPQTLASRCTISGGERGVISLLGGGVIVQDCTITDTSNRGVHIFDGSTMWLYDNIFQGVMEYNVYTSSGAIVGVGNLLAGGTVETIHLGAPDHLDFLGNHILNGGGLSVYAGDSATDPRTLSLENNWWGTSDPAQIEAWIHHAPDDPAANGLTIDYMPFYGGPVPTEQSSVGRLKATFSEQ